MGLRDLLRKKDEVAEGGAWEHGRSNSGGGSGNVPPEFVFMRSDTTTHDFIEPPSGPKDSTYLAANAGSSSRMRRSVDVLRPRSASHDASSRSRSASVSSQVSATSSSGRPRRLSQRLHLSREPETSDRVPEDLPAIAPTSGDPRDAEAAESQWERRATILAERNDLASSRPSSRSGGPPSDRMSQMNIYDDPNDGGRQNHFQSQQHLNLQQQDQHRRRSSSLGATGGAVSSKQIDENIQEAIRLHEAGDLERSTEMFRRLADPHGANNPLSQVLYGLALRHGWGTAPNPTEAIKHLSAAASNAASVEELALQAGLKKGGAAKGELVLAIFELANCFRHGWGIEKDAVAAKQYYETAANLGDTDAMNEVAWCYLEGYGCKKDKYAAARYYRLAEKAGNKTLGNSWIWKEKYDPGGDGKKKK